ncbi:MAG: hypothetical protein ACPGVG_10800 [Mycobacterium sp.]
MSKIRIRPIWTPEDAAALRAVAYRFPSEVGQSVAPSPEAEQRA